MLELTNETGVKVMINIIKQILKFSVLGFALGFFMGITSILFSLFIKSFSTEITKELILTRLEYTGIGAFIGFWIIIFGIKKVFNYDIRSNKYNILKLFFSMVVGFVFFPEILKLFFWVIVIW